MRELSRSTQLDVLAAAFLHPFVSKAAIKEAPGFGTVAAGAVMVASAAAGGAAATVDVASARFNKPVSLSTDPTLSRLDSGTGFAGGAPSFYPFGVPFCDCQFPLAPIGGDRLVALVGSRSVARGA